MNTRSVTSLLVLVFASCARVLVLHKVIAMYLTVVVWLRSSHHGLPQLFADLKDDSG